MGQRDPVLIALAWLSLVDQAARLGFPPGRAVLMLAPRPLVSLLSQQLFQRRGVLFDSP